MSIHDGIKEKAASGIRRGGLCGDDCLGVRIFDRVVGGEVRRAVFPNHSLGGGQTGGRRKLVDPLFDGRLGDQREGTLGHAKLAVWTLLLNVNAEGVTSVACCVAEVEIRCRDDDGGCAEDWFPSAPEHPGMGSLRSLGEVSEGRRSRTIRHQASERGRVN